MRKLTTCIAAGVLAAGLGAQAATYNYKAGQNWSAATNWENDVLPTFNNEADLVFDANIGVNAMRISSERTVRSITFGSNLAGLNGATIDVQTRNNANTASVNLRLEADSGNATVTMENGFGANNAQVRLGNSTGGNVVLGSSLDLHVNDVAAPFKFDSIVSGTGAINKYGAGLATVTRANTFSGGLNIFQGEFAVWSQATSGGSGAITVGGDGSGDDATLLVGTTTRANDITVNSGTGARTIGLWTENAGNPVLSGAIALNKDATFDIAENAADTHDRITLSGVVSGPGGLVKTGDGILILSGTNTFAGTTTVVAGTLVLAGSETISDLARLALGADTAFGMVFTGVETVEGLSLDGGATWLPNGTYDAAALGGLGSGTYGGDGSIAVQSQTTEIGLVSIQALGSTAVVLEWGSEIGFSYGVEGKTDLVFGEWEPVASNFAGTGGFLAFTGSVSEAKSFYRIVLE